MLPPCLVISFISAATSRFGDIFYFGDYFVSSFILAATTRSVSLAATTRFAASTRIVSSLAATALGMDRG